MNHLFDRFQKAHERAMIFWKKTPSSEFKRSLAIVIGIDCYSNGIPPLTTAVNDASRLGADIRSLA